METKGPGIDPSLPLHSTISTCRIALGASRGAAGRELRRGLLREEKSMPLLPPPALPHILVFLSRLFSILRLCSVNDSAAGGANASSPPPTPLPSSS